MVITKYPALVVTKPDWTFLRSKGPPVFPATVQSTKRILGNVVRRVIAAFVGETFLVV